jgi:DNA-binding XRE family transcriptional regulator
LLPGILREWRQKAALTPEELAQHLGVDEASVERWERGKDLPQLPEFFALAEVFGWPIPRAIVKRGLLLGASENRAVRAMDRSAWGAIAFLLHWLPRRLGMPAQHTLVEESVRDPLPGLKEQLEQEFGDSVSHDRIDRAAEEAFHLFDSARIREFVPVFAWRRARQLVRSSA